jgi:hypothetical protein
VPPSDDLLARAARGDLDADEARASEARKLLASERGAQTLARFLAQWSDYERVRVATRPGVPEFEELKPALVETTRRFLEEVVIRGGGGVREVLTAPDTFAGAGLGTFYGPAPRRGLLEQASILAGRAHADASSPTLRGLFVYERLLCKTRPKPPAVIPALESAAPGTTTTRERYERSHAASAGCNVCHRLFDPIGFAFEHYDEVGRFRETEAGLTIDATGQLEIGGEQLPFDAQAELSQVLANLPEVHACVADLMTSYLSGSAGTPACIASDARAALLGEKIGLTEFAARLAGAPSFTRRALR